MKRLLAFACALFLSSFGPRQAIAAWPCIDLKQSAPFRFEGVLTRQVFAGPPIPEDIRKGDKPEPTYILQLENPICASGDDFADPKKQIDRIQIFPNEENKVSWKQLRKLVGKSVAVEGNSPFGAHTGHHHAALLLPITSVTISP